MPLNQCEVVDAKQEFYQEVSENVKQYLDPAKQNIEARKDKIEAVDN